MPMTERVHYMSRCWMSRININPSGTLCHWAVSDWKLSYEIMREFRSNLRSEHNRYIECEHHLAWKNLNSNFRKCVTKVYNLNWHHLRTDYQKNPLHLSRVECGTWESWGYVQISIWNEAYSIECRVNWPNQRTNIMNCHVSEPDDLHLVHRHHMISTLGCMRNWEANMICSDSPRRNQRSLLWDEQSEAQYLRTA